MSDYFLESFEDLIAKRTGVDRLWAQSCALTALSTAIGSNIRILTQVAPLQLNLFFLNIGASGLARKTIVLEHYLRALLKRLENLTHLKFLLPSDYSTEGLHEYFSAADVIERTAGGDVAIATQNSGCIIKDEFSRFVRETYHKKYMVDQFEFLSKLYDGRIPSRHTVAHGYQGEVEVCINLASASTPNLFTILTEGFFSQGLGNRILYNVTEAQETKREDPTNYFLPKLEGEREALLSTLAETLNNLRENASRNTLFVREDAAEALVNYKYEREEEARGLYLKDRLDLDYSYLVRLPEFAYKLAALKCLDETCKAPPKTSTGDIIEVSDTHTDWAIEKVSEYYANFRKLLEIWDEVKAKADTRVRRRDPEVIKSIIAAAGGIISRTDLRRKAYSRGYTPDQFHQITSQLIETGEVEEKEEQEPKHPGQRTRFFVLTAFQDSGEANRREEQ